VGRWRGGGLVPRAAAAPLAFTKAFYDLTGRRAAPMHAMGFMAT